MNWETSYLLLSIKKKERFDELGDLLLAPVYQTGHPVLVDACNLAYHPLSLNNMTKGEGDFHFLDTDVNHHVLTQLADAPSYHH